MSAPEGEVTAAVERVLAEIYPTLYGGPYTKWEIERGRRLLAAVLPEAQAAAFDDFAARVRAQWAKDGERCPWVGALDDEAARLREGAKGDDEG